MADMQPRVRRRGIAIVATWAGHALRLALVASVLLCMHSQHRRNMAREAGASRAIPLDSVRRFFPEAAALEAATASDNPLRVVDGEGRVLGTVVQTSPAADHIVGFSGPTNVLIAIGPEERILGIEVLSSRDTREHVARVVADARLLHAYDGLHRDEAARLSDVDAVSGATLTSLAIAESILHRLGGRRTSLRFPEPLTADDAQSLFPTAATVHPDPELDALWHVDDAGGERLGEILRTSPAADNIVGYQGPTEALVGLALDGRIIGVAVGRSYDNEPYVGYVRDDAWFLALFNERSLAELAGTDREVAGVEGVSGATMTSIAVADGLIRAAAAHQAALEAERQPLRPWIAWSPRDVGTIAVAVAGLVIGFTPLRGRAVVRIPFQLLLIGYLGLVNGDLLSQAQLVGWAQSGIPWRTAAGLTFLTVVALLTPATTRSNVYCSHVCPHGAAQQLLRRRLPWRVAVPRWLSRMLVLLPAVLLACVVFAGMGRWGLRLVDIEPFDAYVFQIAGAATIAIAIVGLVASLFVPMAYCRYGCPTGAVLNYIRRNSHSRRFQPRDAVALALAVLAAVLWWIG